jgi:hypothetical protein
LQKFDQASFTFLQALTYLPDLMFDRKDLEKYWTQWKVLYGEPVGN